MTIIAFKDGIMAADTAAFIGSVRVSCARPKITRRDDGAIVGAAGCTPVIEAFVAWFMSGLKPDDKPKMEIGEDDLDALIAYPSGELWRCNEEMIPYEVTAPYAIGCATASNVALSVMLWGATAAEAVQHAIDHTRNVGGSVQVERATS